MPIWSSEVNHSSYADEAILFCSGDRYSIIKMMNVLRNYEDVSDQLINKSKSFFYPEKTPLIFFYQTKKAKWYQTR